MKEWQIVELVKEIGRQIGIATDYRFEGDRPGVIIYSGRTKLARLTFYQKPLRGAALFREYVAVEVSDELSTLLRKVSGMVKEHFVTALDDHVAMRRPTAQLTS